MTSLKTTTTSTKRSSWGRRGSAIGNIIWIVVAVLAAAVGVGLVFYAFSSAKMHMAGVGTVMVSASGDAAAQVYTVTVQNMLNNPITISSITVKDVQTGTALTCTCTPNPAGSTVPAGQSVSYTCDCSRSKTKLVSGHKYVVIIVYKTAGGIEKTATTTFVAS